VLPIERAELYLVEIPLEIQWRISLYAASSRRHTFLRITGEGADGWGEASPAPAFMGESASTVYTSVKQHLLSTLVHARSIADLHRRMDAVLPGNPAAKSVLDIAVFDWLARRRNIPVYELLGGRVRQRVPAMWVVGVKDPSAAINEIQKFRERGFTAFKLKLSGEPDRDLTIVDQVRKTFGSELTLRVDANQAYRLHTAIRLFQRLDRYDLDAIEQPLPANDLRGHAELRRYVSTPVMLDESVKSPRDLLEAVRLNATDAVNIKVGKVGGLWSSLQIAAIADAAGIAYTVGSNLELGVGIAASLHLALSLRQDPLPCDLYLGHPLHVADPVETPALLRSGFLEPLSGAGLAIILTPFEQLRKNHIRVIDRYATEIREAA